MNREEIESTLTVLETETKIKAWVFQVNKKFYQVVEYGGVYRVPDATSIWECSKRGKRNSTDPVFTIPSKNYKKCLDLFLDKLEEAEILEQLQKESKE